MTRHRLFTSLFLLLVTVAGMAQTVGSRLTVGTDSFVYRGYAPFADRPLKVVYHVPSKGGLDHMPIIFVLQGADRGHDYLLKGWRARAEKEGFVVFIPQFDKDPYPLSAYQEVGIMDAKHSRLTARDSITPQLIDHLFLHVRQRLGSQRSTYRLYGHSAGGQFVQRFMLFHDSPYVDRAVIGSPGWYTFPDREQSFSYGIKNVPYVDDVRLRRYFAKDIIVQLAEGDTVREWFLRKTPEADRQGRNRLDRGRTFYDYCRRLCLRRGWPFRWRLVEEPGLGHQSVEMGMRAVPYLMEPSGKDDFHAPTLSRPTGMAPSARIYAFMDSLVAAHKAVATSQIIATTPQGRPVKAFYLQRRGHGKAPLRLWLMAGLHGNEPAPPDVMCNVAAWLLTHPDGRRLIDSLAIALVPVANPDGYDAGKRSSSIGLDLNRDQTKMADPLSAQLKRAWLAWNPHVSLDMHEFNPLRREFQKIGKETLETAYDVLFLPSGHPNIDPRLRQMTTALFDKSAREALTRMGYTAGDYFTPSFTPTLLAINKNAKSPQSSSTWNALAGSVSLFVEIKGIGMGRRLFDKRVSCGFIVARDYLLTAFRHREAIVSAVAEARKDAMAGKRPVVVTSTSAVCNDTLRFVSHASGDSLRVAVTARDALNSRPTLTRRRPKAYLLADSCGLAVVRLRAMGIEIKPLGRAMTAEVGCYVVTSVSRDSTLWEGIRPVSVTTRVEKRRLKFSSHTFIAYTSQPLGNLLVSVMEPEAACGLVNFGAMEPRTGRELPVYRWE